MKKFISSLLACVRSHKIFLLALLALEIFMLAFFLLTNIGTETYRLLLQARRYLFCAIGVTFVLHLWRKAELPWQKLLPCCIVSGSWFFVYNIASYLTNYKSATNLNNYMDIAFAAYIFCFMAFAHLLLRKFNLANSASANILLSLCQCVLLVIPALTLAYYFYYDATPSVTAAIAMLQTNPHEALEYLQQLGMPLIAAFGFFLLAAMLLFYKFNHFINNNISGRMNFTPPEKYFSCLLIFFLCFYLPKSFLKTGVISSFKQARAYLAESQEFHLHHADAFANLQVERRNEKLSRPHSVILVIGESYGRNFMSAYGYAANNTTPWLKESIEKDAGHFLRFNHAYSTFGSTVQALEQALTEKNQYNARQFKNSATILDLAKKAGYKTYWFSNQGVKNSTDTPIQIVGKTADVHHWIEDNPDAGTKILYDEDLLPCLEQVNPAENNFIVLHVMGCHELTIHRFPEERTQFGKKGVFDLIPNYEDALAYNDWVLQKAHAYAKENLNLQAMLIFSDHGANPYRKRTAENIPFINVRIPLIIYLADDYQAAFPETTQALRANLDKYYSNDLLFETIGGILNIASPSIEPRLNIASLSYNLTRSTTKTYLGSKTVAEDIHENEIEY